MSQQRIFDYRSPNSTELLNNKFTNILPAGIYDGFTVSKNGQISPGVLLTKEGVRISEDLPINLLVPFNETAYSRIDIIVCRHEYIKTVPAPPAEFKIIAGQPSENPVPKNLPENSVLLAKGFLEGGQTEYSTIEQVGKPDEIVNVYYDNKNWRIIKGSLSAFRKTFNVNSCKLLIYIIPPGRYRDNEVIEWGNPVATIDEKGFLELNNLAGQGRTTETVKQNADDIKQEIQIREELFNHLINTLSVEETERKADVLSLQNQLKTAKGTENWNDSLSSNIENLHNRVTTIESNGGTGLPDHNSRHEKGGDDEISFDKLRDGKDFIKMKRNERERLQSAYNHINNDFIHISKFQKNQLVNELNCNIHHHDEKYYKKSWIDTNAIQRKADKYHNHDSRYLRQRDYKTDTFEPGEKKLIKAFSTMPDHIKVTYNYLAADGMPDQPTYITGERSDEITCSVQKTGYGGNKDFEVYIENRSVYHLWINIDFFTID